MRALKGLAAMAGLLAIAAGTMGASAETLRGADLQRAVSGKRIFLAVPLGGEFPLNYRPDGRVDGSGDAVGLGRFMKPSDSGTWWVAGEKLCQQWRTWYDGRVFCFTIARSGPNRLAWVRDDGSKGVARVAD
ncbi:hypothetical protein ABEG18_10735 [Alsobacter sp. KACC 23698]|uniref:Dihydrodipicolinate reductase n=1 Tax=Alsobacter sp. KACC 23698 TaxID=3149229 RepID=A0AAU7JLA9_9HYPH